jgi:hypothetical protein
MSFVWMSILSFRITIVVFLVIPMFGYMYFMYNVHVFTTDGLDDEKTMEISFFINSFYVSFEQVLGIQRFRNHTEKSTDGCYQAEQS